MLGGSRLPRRPSGIGSLRGGDEGGLKASGTALPAAPSRANGASDGAFGNSMGGACIGAGSVAATGGSALSLSFAPSLCCDVVAPLTPGVVGLLAVGASVTVDAGAVSGFRTAGRAAGAGLLDANGGGEEARGGGAVVDDASLGATWSWRCEGVPLTVVGPSEEEVACPKSRGGSRRIEAATTSATAAAPVATRSVRFDRRTGVIRRSDKTSLTIFVFTGLA